VIYVFYNNDPLAQDLGGGAEHFRGLHRALLKSGLDFRLIAARLQNGRSAPQITYISRGSNYLRFYLALWLWFWRHRHELKANDVFHFHRNYGAWPKLLLCGRKGRVVISYHNVTGRVLEGWLGRLALPLRRAMLALERRVTAVADAIICVSNRDREILGRVVLEEPFAGAAVIPAAYDSGVFKQGEASPPRPDQARSLVFLGRISHQKNVPLAVATLEALIAEGHDYRLTIAGDGEGASDLIKRINLSPAKAHIDWIGRVPHDAIPGLLEAHGILLLTSRYEASPTVVKEALEAMRPVVTTDVGDVPDWIDEDMTGFIREPTAESLADGVLAATRLIEEGRYRHTERMAALSEEAIMGRVMQLYRHLQAV